MRFEEALAEMRKGKSVRRGNKYPLKIYKGIVSVVFSEESKVYDYEIMLDEEDINANDWEIVDEIDSL